MNDRYNYLITGASGFLGKILSNHIQFEGHKIIGLDRNSQQVNVNITESFSLDSGLSVDVVIHAAGKAHSVPKTPEESQVFFDVNLQGTKNLCYALEKLATLPKSFIFFSTVAVYGLDKGSFVNESHPLNGDTPYAKSKIQAEEWLVNWAKEHHVTLGILRLPLIAGPNPPGNLGALINGIKSGRYLSIGKADARKSIVWAGDIAGIIPTLAERGGIFNITDGYHPSFGELEHVISEAFSKRKPVNIPTTIAKCLGYLGDLVGERFPLNSDKLKKITSSLTFDDSKARNELNWNPSSVLLELSNCYR